MEHQPRVKSLRPGQQGAETDKIVVKVEVARLGKLAELDRPLLVGPSRKRFIGHALAEGGEDRPVGERLMGTAATVAACVLGGAHMVRVHDVREMVQVARVCDAVLAGD